MAGTSTLDPDNYSAPRRRRRDRLHEEPALGPSDSSDSGSDVAAQASDDDSVAAANDSDRYGTGENAGARKDAGVRIANDIETDRVVGEEEAGLGDGPDEAEEARAGITTDEVRAALAEKIRAFRKRRER